VELITDARDLEEAYWRGYRHGVRTMREAAEWSEKRADECVQALTGSGTCPTPPPEYDFGRHV
jgi:hypothetical protein